MTLEFPQSVRRELLAAARGAADVELLDVMLLLAHGIDPHVEPDDCRTRIDELAELAMDGVERSLFLRGLEEGARVHAVRDRH